MPFANRTAIATAAVRASGYLSRALGVGTGSTIGGRVGLLVDPDLVAELAAGRDAALVSGTNGKTTTTRLLVEALGGPDVVASSGPGANMPAGLASALAGGPPGGRAVLEVDERYLSEMAAALSPRVIVLLNLSRDQLDRMSEVRMVAERWRSALAGFGGVVVANADDPLVTYAARSAARSVFVAAGGRWHEDAYHCPACDARIEFTKGGGWSCRCGFARPQPDAWLAGNELVLGDGRRSAIELSLPGEFNRANAAMAALAAEQFGVPIEQSLRSAAAVDEVAGRFAVVSRAGVAARLLLAKNPAGWAELIGLLEQSKSPVVVGINARLADGHDPSWLWDVEFERLAGRTVVATGERRLDLAVRLRHAGVDHLVEADQLRALELPGAGRVDYVGNYTAFQSLRRRLASGNTPPREAARPAVRPAPAGPKRRRRRPSTLSVVVVHPDLLGTYGDGGNGRVLVDRANWRDTPAELVLAPSDEALPSSADAYVLGGGEDGPQVRAAERLREGNLAKAVEGGAVVLAVCAGFQIIGRSFPGAGGEVAGAGLLEVETVRTTERRAVGEIATAVLADADWPGAPGVLTGFENHQARTRLADGTRPLGRVLFGVGNGPGSLDGAVAGRVFGTYLHGPVLARNPAFADLLLSLITGKKLAPLDDEEEQALRAERLRRNWAGRLRRVLDRR